MYVIDADQVGTCSGERQTGGGRTARRTLTIHLARRQGEHSTVGM
jgi:hypothetical protein